MYLALWKQICKLVLLSDQFELFVIKNNFVVLNVVVHWAVSEVCQGKGRLISKRIVVSSILDLRFPQSYIVILLWIFPQFEVMRSFSNIFIETISMKK